MEQREASTGTTPATSSTSSTNSNVCPICLGPIKQEAYLDRCFHTFCYHCIASWTKYVSRQHSQPLTSIMCPLCKSGNSSIIYGFSGNFFQWHHVNKDPESSFLTQAHQFRWQCYAIETGMVQHKFDVLSYWKNKKYLRQNQFLQTWLRREIQTLLQFHRTTQVISSSILAIQCFLVASIIVDHCCISNEFDCFILSGLTSTNKTRVAGFTSWRSIICFFRSTRIQSQ